MTIKNVFTTPPSTPTTIPPSPPSVSNMMVKDIIHDFWILCSVKKQGPPSLKDFELFVNNLSQSILRDESEFKIEFKYASVEEMEYIFEYVVNNGIVDNYLFLRLFPGDDDAIMISSTFSLDLKLRLLREDVYVKKSIIELIQKRVVEIQLIRTLANGTEIANKRYINIDALFADMNRTMDLNLRKAGFDIPMKLYGKPTKWDRIPMYELQHMQFMQKDEEEEYLKSEHIQQWIR